MTQLALIAVLSAVCNGSVYWMLRDSRLPRDLPPAAPFITADVPDATFDSIGLT